MAAWIYQLEYIHYNMFDLLNLESCRMDKIYKLFLLQYPEMFAPGIVYKWFVPSYLGTFLANTLYKIPGLPNFGKSHSDIFLTKSLPFQILKCSFWATFTL